MKKLILRAGACALAISAVASCTTCGERGGPVAQTTRRVVDTINEWGCIPSPNPQWRPTYGWNNVDYLLHCCDRQPAPAKWCRLETP